MKFNRYAICLLLVLLPKAVLQASEKKKCESLLKQVSASKKQLGPWRKTIQEYRNNIKQKLEMLCSDMAELKSHRSNPSQLISDTRIRLRSDIEFSLGQLSIWKHKLKQSDDEILGMRKKDLQRFAINTINELNQIYYSLLATHALPETIVKQSVEEKERHLIELLEQQLWSDKEIINREREKIKENIARHKNEIEEIKKLIKSEALLLKYAQKEIETYLKSMEQDFKIVQQEGLLSDIDLLYYARIGTHKLCIEQA